MYKQQTLRAYYSAQQVQLVHYTHTQCKAQRISDEELALSKDMLALAFMYMQHAIFAHNSACTNKHARLQYAQHAAIAAMQQLQIVQEVSIFEHNLYESDYNNKKI